MVRRTLNAERQSEGQSPQWLDSSRVNSIKYFHSGRGWGKLWPMLLRFPVMVAMKRMVGVASIASITVCSMAAEYDLIIRNGAVYDGSGNAPLVADVAIKGESIAAVGHLETVRAQREIDARGLAVAPGFINLLSWATESLIEDGRSQSDIRQGVTLEIFGEGWSLGPLNEKMKKEAVERQGDIKYEIK